MKIKKPKRIMSLFLAALMCVTSFAGIGTTAYSAPCNQPFQEYHPERLSIQRSFLGYCGEYVIARPYFLSAL